MEPPEPPAVARPAKPGPSTWVLILLAVLLVAAVLAVPAVLDRGGGRNPGAAGGSGSSAPTGRRPVPGFGEGTLEVLVVAPGSRVSPAEHCSLLAATAAQQARGLMTRRDLSGYASMVFRYAEDVRASFYNRNVPMALTVAWFDRDGRWVGSHDLEPCPDMDGCPTIMPPAPFRYGLEVEKGGLARLGLGPGSQIAFSEGC